MTRHSRAVLLLGAVVALGASGLVPAAGAVSTTSSGASVPTSVPISMRTAVCHVGQAAPSLARRTASAGHTALDMPRYTAAQLRHNDRVLRLALAAATSSPSRRSARTAMTLRVPVHAHVVSGQHRGEAGPGRRDIGRQLRILNRGYAGGQAEVNEPTPFAFYLASFEKVRNDRWFHAGPTSPEDRQMRRRLHRGGADDLNVYFTRPDNQILGYSSVPWQYRRHPLTDGVTINIESMPGGSAPRYNEGDTAVHEVGHWLGLYHTFEGGCSRRNDRVADTAQEQLPSFECDRGRDTCSAPGTDPIHNFLDYSYDSCMDRFTPGQVRRMADNWLAFRTP